MQKYAIIILITIMAFLFSCEDNGLVAPCADCTAEEPILTELEIKFDINSGAVIRIYEGNLEDNILLDEVFNNNSPYLYEASVNKQYTVTATYNINNNTYIAVDSATPRVKFEKNQCDEPCYYVYDKVCNIKLKYTK